MDLTGIYLYGYMLHTHIYISKTSIEKFILPIYYFTAGEKGLMEWT